MRIVTSTEIGTRLQIFRKKAGISREQLAELMGVSPNQVHKYENGLNLMNTDRLQRAAQALSVPIQSFFSDTVENCPPVGSEKILIDFFRAIDDDDVKQALIKLAARAVR